MSGQWAAICRLARPVLNSGAMFLRCAPWLVASLLLVAGAAEAQTLAVPTDIDRHEADGNMLPNWVNLNDCTNDEVINFDIQVTGTGSQSYGLMAFVGSSCDVPANRTGTNPTCFKVTESHTATYPNTRVPIRVRDIIAAVKGTGFATVDGGVATDAGSDAGGEGGAGSGTGDDLCSGLLHPTDFTVYFMLVNSNNEEPTENYMSANWPGQVDLTGPSAPTLNSAGKGENTLVVNWTIDLETPVGEMDAFGIYCNPPASKGPDTDAGTNCDPGVLIPGAPPPMENLCGEAPGTGSSRQTDALTNGVSYTVAVAGRDTFYNVGPLSNTVCETPEPVTGFFEAYRAAGGKAGGGFCAVNAGRSATGALFAALALACFVARRRFQSKRTDGSPR